MPLKGHATITLKNVSQKIDKYFEIYFLFYIDEFDVMKRKKNIWSFTLISLGCKSFFISDVETFFSKDSCVFQEKNWFCFNVFCQCFLKVIDDNRSTHTISSFPFFILRCNMNTHKQKFWLDTKGMRTEEDPFPIALIHVRTILVGLSFTNI